MANITMARAWQSYRADAKAEPLPVLRELSLTVEQGEFVSIIGPSGCGKSTLFRVLTGLETLDSGSLHVNGSLGYMPQKDLLMPWRTVLDNAVLGLELRGSSKQEAKARAQALIADFGLAGFEHSYPAQLSGGMRQRVALLRTMLPGDELLLLDEPFGALDAITRFKMQQWLLEVWHKHRPGVLFITHDIEEALFLSDRIYVFSERPASVKLELQVNLPRPRTKGMVTEPRFVALKEELLAQL